MQKKEEKTFLDYGTSEPDDSEFNFFILISLSLFLFLVLVLSPTDVGAFGNWIQLCLLSPGLLLTWISAARGQNRAFALALAIVHSYVFSMLLLKLAR